MKKTNRKADWPKTVREHLAIASVGGSTLRGQCAEGGVSLSRDFLTQKVPITDLNNMQSKEFSNFLNAKTKALSKKLIHPIHKTPNFGAARKVINIFFRLCAMNKDLHRKFKLAKVEPFLEVPLDGDVVGKIRNLMRDNGYDFELPPVFTIRDLTTADNKLFQNAASQIAEDYGLHRYELDVLWWGR